MSDRVPVLYFSGVGGTKLVAELLAALLAPRFSSRAIGIDEELARESIAASDFLVICYPTYYLKPAPSMREFIESLEPPEGGRNAYVVTTCELYAENSIRSCALMLRDRGVTVVGSKAVRAPGTDVTCVLPRWLCPWLYRFEPGLAPKLRAIAGEIEARIEEVSPRPAVPAVKWYTPFSQLLQVSVLDRFDAFRGRMSVLRNRCTLCGTCVAACDRGALAISGGELRHDAERCELCTRCVHRCPRRAIVLVKALKDNPRLDPRLYAALKARALGELNDHE